MNKQRVATVLGATALLAFTAGLIWLMTPLAAPAPQNIEQVLPDDRISR